MLLIGFRPKPYFFPSAPKCQMTSGSGILNRGGGGR
jgi:hypothetical protein